MSVDAGRPTLLFDIDGTLIDSAGAGRGAIETALLEVYGTAGPIDDFPFDGRTDPEIARVLLGRAGLTAGDIDEGLPRLWRTYTANLKEEVAARKNHMKPLPGVPELLDAVSEMDVGVGLVTGNIEAGAQTKLTAVGLWERFSFGGYASDADDRNDIPPFAIRRATEASGARTDPERTWIIGDTGHDVACAHACGLQALGVATGRFSVEQLLDFGADEALSSLRNTPRVLSILGLAGVAVGGLSWR